MEAKVTCVYNEGSLPETNLIGAKGLSLLVDVDGKRVLFDTGRRGRYLTRNLANLEIDLDSIDFVVVSHDHKDHSGGLPIFVSERKEKVVVYAPSGISGKKDLFRRPMFPEESLGKALFMESDDWTVVTDRLALSPPGESGERFLLLATAKGPVVIAGSCHDGVASVLSAAKEKSGEKPHALIGGTNLNKKGRANAAAVAKEVKESFGNVRMVLNHSTGYDGINGMREVFGLGGVEDFYVGSSISFKTSPDRPSY